VSKDPASRFAAWSIRAGFADIGANARGQMFAVWIRSATPPSP
jgi:hypothetical protein